MITKFTSLFLLATISTAAQISNTNLLFSQNTNARDQAFGKVIGDSTINDPDSLEFKYNNKEAFYEAAQSDNSLLQLGNSNDLLYQQEFANLEQSNIGKYQEVKEHLQKNETSEAIQKLSAIVDLNLKEQHLKTVNSIIALLYDPAMDADSDTVVVLESIAYQHPFYGGEAVYWARAILHLNIIDKLQPLRRSLSTSQPNIENKSKFLGKLYPNPAKNEVTFSYPHSEFENITIKIVDTYGKELLESRLLEYETKFNIAGYLQAVYYIHVYVNGIDTEVHRMVIIR